MAELQAHAAAGLRAATHNSCDVLVGVVGGGVGRCGMGPEVLPWGPTVSAQGTSDLSRIEDNDE